MSYIDQTAIETVYGANNVATWGNFTPGAASPDATRLAQAISYAESVFENTVRSSRYAVPLTAVGGGAFTDAQALTAIATLAGWWLWKTRNINVSDSYQTYMTTNHNYAIGVFNGIASSKILVNAALRTASQGVNAPMLSSW